jgi:hypothetical protein
MLKINQALYQIRNANGKEFSLAYVRSTGKQQGSVGSGTFLFQDFIDTRQDLIKVLHTGENVVKTIKISHIISFNNQAISH